MGWRKPDHHRMPRYIAFLRGVSPLNARMPALRECFEQAGFSDVRTLLSSGNVAFSTRQAPTGALERRVERALQTHLGRSFETFVRPTAELQQMLASDPFAAFELAPAAKRVVTFLHEPVDPGLPLPPGRDGARILFVSGREVFVTYVPGPKGPAFMALLERTFGKHITTRTIDTVRRCAEA